jgi:translocator protein
MKTHSSAYSLAMLGAFILITFLAPAVGAFSPPGAWYQTLVKPSWNPPSWIFGPVWTALYLMMAIAAWIVWKRVGRGPALTLYFAQLALNAAWTPVFFGAHQLGAAFIVIVCLWTAILFTLRAFWDISRPAGLLLVPYLAWVSFASALNFTLWRLNS